MFASCVGLLIVREKVLFAMHEEVLSRVGGKVVQQKQESKKTIERGSFLSEVPPLTWATLTTWTT